MKKTICLLPGDGIGPEIVAQGVAVLEAVAKKFGHEFDFVPALIGGAAIDATGEPLPAATVEACQKADAVYLGAVGGPKWDNIEPARRPEKGLLGIRKALGLFANLRPALLLPELASANFNLRSFGERCAMNSPIQGTAADIIKAAMVRVDARMRAEGLEAQLLLQVHDELIVECPAAEAETVRAILIEEMEHVVDYRVPLLVDAKIGASWAEAH